MSDRGSPDSVRLDKWLWAARFYKTRSLAAHAIDGGKVQVNGQRVKRSRVVQPGDEVRMRHGPFEHQLVVLSVSEHRGPAQEARRLYQETPASRAARERLATQLRSQPTITYEGKGRPTKRDRRRLDRWSEPGD